MVQNFGYSEDLALCRFVQAEAKIASDSFDDYLDANKKVLFSPAHETSFPSLNHLI